MRYRSCALLLPIGLALLGCDPTVERDNPFDPATPLGEQAPARVGGAVWVERAAGDGPGAVEVQTIAPDGAVELVAVDPASGAFSFERSAGRYTVVMRAEGYRDERFGLDLAIGDRVELDRRVLLDAGPPVPPTLIVPAAPGPIRVTQVAAQVRHPEAGVRVELSGDVARVEGEGEDRTVELSAGDGPKRIEATAVDPAGHHSATVALIVTLDTTGPAAGGWLRVAGGAPEVRSREVDVDVFDAPADAVRIGLSAQVGGDCRRDDCPALDCERALGGGLRLTLDPMPGPQCVCGTICDAAGNGTALEPAAVVLGPSQPRPVPVLERLEPDTLRAEPGAATVVVHGAGIAGDTTVDIGPFTGLPCHAEAAELCVAGDPETCATACAVEVPEALRLASGEYVVWLRTPAPVLDGDGRSASARLSIVPHRPLIDRVEPQGALAEDGVRVRIEAFDLTDNVQFGLAGRPPSSVALSRDPAQPRAVVAELVFDLSGVPARFEADQTLAVTNPGGERIELPFGVVPAVYTCPPRGPCRVPVRRTMRPGPPGHVVVSATMPDDGRAWSVLLTGGSWWSLLGPSDDGAERPSLARAAARLGGLFLPLPGPQPEAILRAEVPAHAGGSVGLETRRNRPQLAAVQCPVVVAELADGEVGAAVFADLDGDGVADAIAAHGQSGRISTVVDGAVAVYDVGGSPAALATADLDGDGRADLVIGDRAVGRVRVMAGRGDGALDAPLDLPLPEAPGVLAAVAVTDLDGDRLPDVLAGYSAGLGDVGGVLRWQARADGRWVGPTVWADGGPAHHLAVADVDQDGLPDVLYGGPQGIFQRRSGRRDGASEPITVDGEQLTGPWFAISDRDRYSIQWLTSRGLDADGTPIVWSLGGRPGEGWQAARNTVAEVHPEFVVLSQVDTTRDGRGDLLGAQPTGVGRAHEIVYVDPSLGDGIDQAQPTGIELDHAPIALTTHVSPWGADDVAQEAPDFTLSAVLVDGSIVRTEPCANGNPDDDRGEIPLTIPVPFDRVDRVWTDMNADGWVDEVRLVNGDLSVTPWLGEGSAGEQRRAFSVGLHDPREVPNPDLPQEDEPPPDADEPPPQAPIGGEIPCIAPVARTSGLAVAGEPGAKVVAFGRGTGVVRVEWPPVDPCPSDWPAVDVGDAVRDVHPVQAEGGLWLVVVTEADVRLIPPAGRARSLRTCVRGLPEPLDGAARVADFAPDVLGEEVHVSAGDRAWLWTPGDACPVAIDAPDPPALDWRAGDMDGDGLPDRVALLDLPDEDGLMTVHAAVFRAMEPGVFEADPRSPPVPASSRRADGDARLALADLNADGRLDVLVAVEPGDPALVRGRMLLGRGQGALGPAMWIRPTRGEVARDPIDVAAADLTGDGQPDAVTSIGIESGGTVMASRNLSTLQVRDTVARALDDGQPGAFTMPAVWVESATLLVELAEPAPLTGGRLRGPRGDAVALVPGAPRPADTLHWWRSVDAGALGGLLGRQPAGEWTLELETGEPAVVVARELILGIRWVRARDQAEWDADDDGIPDVNDACPEQAAWPQTACVCASQCVDLGQGDAALDACRADVDPSVCR